MIKKELDTILTSFKIKGDSDVYKIKTIDHIWVTFRDNSVTEKIIQKFEIVHPVIKKLRGIFKMENKEAIKFEDQ